MSTVSDMDIYTSDSIMSSLSASYALTVRGAEYANFPEALKDMVGLEQSRNLCDWVG